MSSRSHRQPAGKRSLSILLIALGLVLAAGILVSTLLVQQPQDTRQQASIQDGLVKLSIATQPAEVRVNTPTKVIFSVNTNSLQIDGIEMQADIHTVVADSIEFALIPQSGLKALSTETIRTQTGFRVKIMAVKDIGVPYSNNKNVAFAQAQFTPVRTGNIDVYVDPDNSLATIYDNDPVEDQLAILSMQRFTAQQALAQATASPATAPTNAPTASPTVAPGVGGPSPVSCNQRCDSNANCQAGLICHVGRCRLSTNPSSTSCMNPPDGGLQRSCDQYCANTQECKTGLVCHFNRCRLPSNLDSNSCQAPSSPAATAATSGATATTTPKPTAVPSPTPFNYEASNEVPLNNVFGNVPGDSPATPRPLALVDRNSNTNSAGNSDTKADSSPFSNPNMSVQTMVVAIITILSVTGFGLFVLPMIAKHSQFVRLKISDTLQNSSTPSKTQIEMSKFAGRIPGAKE